MPLLRISIQRDLKYVYIAVEVKIRFSNRFKESFERGKIISSRSTRIDCNREKKWGEGGVRIDSWEGGRKERVAEGKWRELGTISGDGRNSRGRGYGVGGTRSRTTAPRDTISGNLIKVVAGTAYTC